MLPVFFIYFLISLLNAELQLPWDVERDFWCKVVGGMPSVLSSNYQYDGDIGVASMSTPLLFEHEMPEPSSPLGCSTVLSSHQGCAALLTDTNCGDPFMPWSIDFWKNENNTVLICKKEGRSLPCEQFERSHLQNDICINTIVHVEVMKAETTLYLMDLKVSYSLLAVRLERVARNGGVLLDRNSAATSQTSERLLSKRAEP
ncbi:unnamed protein product, partial [Mesorhabditis spiculigera]